MTRAAHRRAWLPLACGMAVVLPVVLAALWPGMLTPTDPEQRGPAMRQIDGVWWAPPYPPSTAYWLGSDLAGRDQLSRLIHGAAPTLSLALGASALRLGVGIALGIAAVLLGGTLGHAIAAAAEASAALPPLLFAFLIIVTIGAHAGAPLFVIALGLSGWAPWTHLVVSVVQRLAREPYLEAARAIGATRWSLARHYLVPALAPSAIPAAAQEFAAVLLLIAELGFLGVFLGIDAPLRLSDLLAGDQPNLPAPEWGGMLAGTRMVIFRQFWLPLAPAAVVLWTILGISLVAEGLRRRLAWASH
jgi:peptide/nickel transport system permease protein